MYTPEPLTAPGVAVVTMHGRIIGAIKAIPHKDGLGYVAYRNPDTQTVGPTAATRVTWEQARRDLREWAKGRSPKYTKHAVLSR